MLGRTRSFHNLTSDALSRQPPKETITPMMVMGGGGETSSPSQESWSTLSSPQQSDSGSLEGSVSPEDSDFVDEYELDDDEEWEVEGDNAQTDKISQTGTTNDGETTSDSDTTNTSATLPRTLPTPAPPRNKLAFPNVVATPTSAIPENVASSSQSEDKSTTPTWQFTPSSAWEESPEPFERRKVNTSARRSPSEGSSIVVSNDAEIGSNGSRDNKGGQNPHFITKSSGHPDIYPLSLEASTAQREVELPTEGEDDIPEKNESNAESHQVPIKSTTMDGGTSVVEQNFGDFMSSQPKVGNSGGIQVSASVSTTRLGARTYTSPSVGPSDQLINVRATDLLMRPSKNPGMVTEVEKVLADFSMPYPKRKSPVLDDLTRVVRSAPRGAPPFTLTSSRVSENASTHQQFKGQETSLAPRSFPVSRDGAGEQAARRIIGSTKFPLSSRLPLPLEEAALAQLPVRSRTDPVIVADIPRFGTALRAPDVSAALPLKPTSALSRSDTGGYQSSGVVLMQGVATDLTGRDESVTSSSSVGDLVTDSFRSGTESALESMATREESTVPDTDSTTVTSHSEASDSEASTSYSGADSDLISEGSLHRNFTGDTSDKNQPMSAASGRSGSSRAAPDLEKSKTGNPTEDHRSTETSLYDRYERAIGWAVVFASFLACACTSSGVLTWSIQVRFLVAEGFIPNLSNWLLFLPGSIGLGLLFALATVADKCAENLGFRLCTLFGGFMMGGSLLLSTIASQYWHFLLTQGVMFGIGGSFGLFPSVSLISQWFHPRRRILAHNIAMSGFSVGPMVASPALHFFHDWFGTQWTIRGLGIVIGALMLVAAFPLQRRKPARRERTFNDVALFGNRNFLPLWLGAFVTAFGYFVPWFLVPLFCTSIGLSPVQSSVILGAMNGAGVIGRLILSGFAIGTDGRTALMGSLVVSGAATLAFWPNARNFVLLMSFASVYGAMIVGYHALLPQIATELYAADSVHIVIGMLSAAGSLGAFAGPLIAGYLVDASTLNGAANL
ncbi:hypothetical protein HDU93_001970 [Gonapodya sp. JEL0774]|nr:hypothetical protein HDU93_001970 [Gonapodya sp. JEL0774]